MIKLKKMKFINIPQKKKKQFKKKTKNKSLIIIIGLFIALIIIISTYLIFFSKKKSKIYLKTKKNTDLNILPAHNYTTIKKVQNFDSNNITDKVSYIDGKLFWNNEKTLDQLRIRNEIREYNNIQLSFENKEDFIKRENPLITIVITIYNQENKIKSIYASIQKQELKDIEIIFVDDASTDESAKVIKLLMEKDKRIVYLKNDVNKRAFYSRYKGVLNSKGNYVLVIDPDDLLINNILIKAYGTAIKYDLDIVQFYMLIGYYNSPNLWSDLKYSSGILKGNSEIRKIFYYGISRNLPDKLIRRETFIKSIKFMKPEYYELDYHINDDDTAFFGLIHVAESYGFLEQIGYFYVLRYPTPENHKKFLDGLNSGFESMANIFKYFYYQSDNNTLEKSNICYKYFEKNNNNLAKHIKDLTGGFDPIIDALNLYSNSTYFNDIQKIQINSFKNKIIARKKEVQEHK